VGGEQAVGRAVIFDQAGLVDAGRRRAGRGVDRHGRVGRAVDDQGRHIDAGQVRPEIGGAERIDAVERAFQARLHGDPPRPIERRVRHRVADHADAEEVFEEAPKEIRPVLANAGLDALEHRCVGTVGIVRAFQQIGHDRADQRGLADAFALVAGHVARDLAAAHREADQGDAALDVGGFDHVGKIVCESVVIIAFPGLIRPPEPAAIVRDHPIACVRERDRDIVPAVGRERPAMDQDDGPPAFMAPILDVNLRPVPRFDEWHWRLPLLMCIERKRSGEGGSATCTGARPFACEPRER
jgi:hypothetical protein